MKDIRIPPHTFFRKQSVTADSELSMFAGDAWNMDEGKVGGSVNVADLQYNQTV